MAKADPLDDALPRFARRFPDDPALGELTRAFAQGNYLLVRRRAPELIAQAEDPRVRRAAKELLTRIEPDPLAKYLLGLAVLLLATLIALTYLKQH
ncbi:MAG TPA: hypothetical protein VKZ49_14940 [Polyangiaceae bacterium]|nr:hypothetical protein [Polyangiaceae bacterium]